MIRAILFDLDDTLYAECDFHASVFAAVARELELRGVGPRDELQSSLLALHRDNREQVFDRAASQWRFPSAWIPELVSLCRTHQPSLSLPKQTRRILTALKTDYRIGCVTDGWAAVQRAKIAALGLEPLFHALVIADDFGPSFWKPHPRPFLDCCEQLGVSPDQAIFVGDHPDRDLLGARRANMRCVRLRRPDGYFAKYDSSHSADLEISDLSQLRDAVAILQNRSEQPSIC